MGGIKSKSGDGAPSPDLFSQWQSPRQDVPLHSETELIPEQDPPQFQSETQRVENRLGKKFTRKEKKQLQETQRKLNAFLNRGVEKIGLAWKKLDENTGLKGKLKAAHFYTQQQNYRQALEFYEQILPVFDETYAEVPEDFDQVKIFQERHRVFDLYQNQLEAKILDSFKKFDELNKKIKQGKEPKITTEVVHNLGDLAQLVQLAFTLKTPIESVLEEIQNLKPAAERLELLVLLLFKTIPLNSSELSQKIWAMLEISLADKPDAQRDLWICTRLFQAIDDTGIKMKELYQKILQKSELLSVSLAEPRLRGIEEKYVEGLLVARHYYLYLRKTERVTQVDTLLQKTRDLIVETLNQPSPALKPQRRQELAQTIVEIDQKLLPTFSISPLDKTIVSREEATEEQRKRSYHYAEGLKYLAAESHLDKQQFVGKKLESSATLMMAGADYLRSSKGREALFVESILRGSLDNIQKYQVDATLEELIFPEGKTSLLTIEEEEKQMSLDAPLESSLDDPKNLLSAPPDWKDLTNASKEKDRVFKNKVLATLQARYRQAVDEGDTEWLKENLSFLGAQFFASQLYTAYYHLDQAQNSQGLKQIQYYQKAAEHFAELRMEPEFLQCAVELLKLTLAQRDDSKMRADFGDSLYAEKIHIEDYFKGLFDLASLAKDKHLTRAATEILERIEDEAGDIENSQEAELFFAFAAQLKLYHEGKNSEVIEGLRDLGRVKVDGFTLTTDEAEKLGFAPSRLPSFERLQISAIADRLHREELLKTNLAAVGVIALYLEEGKNRIESDSGSAVGVFLGDVEAATHPDKKSSYTREIEALLELQKQCNEVVQKLISGEAETLQEGFAQIGAGRALEYNRLVPILHQLVELTATYPPPRDTAEYLLKLAYKMEIDEDGTLAPLAIYRLVGDIAGISRGGKSSTEKLLADAIYRQNGLTGKATYAQAIEKFFRQRGTIGLAFDIGLFVTSYGIGSMTRVALLEMRTHWLSARIGGGIAGFGLFNFGSVARDAATQNMRQALAPDNLLRGTGARFTVYFGFPALGAASRALSLAGVRALHSRGFNLLTETGLPNALGRRLVYPVTHLGGIYGANLIGDFNEYAGLTPAPPGGEKEGNVGHTLGYFEFSFAKAFVNRALGGTLSTFEEQPQQRAMILETRQRVESLARRTQLPLSPGDQHLLIEALTYTRLSNPRFALKELDRLFEQLQDGKDQRRDEPFLKAQSLLDQYKIPLRLEATLRPRHDSEIPSLHLSLHPDGAKIEYIVFTSSENIRRTLRNSGIELTKNEEELLFSALIEARLANPDFEEHDLLSLLRHIERSVLRRDANLLKEAQKILDRAEIPIRLALRLRERGNEKISSLEILPNFSHRVDRLLSEREEKARLELKMVFIDIDPELLDNFLNYLDKTNPLIKEKSHEEALEFWIDQLPENKIQLLLRLSHLIIPKRSQSILDKLLEHGQPDELIALCKLSDLATEGLNRFIDAYADLTIRMIQTPINLFSRTHLEPVFEAYERLSRLGIRNFHVEQLVIDIFENIPTNLFQVSKLIILGKIAGDPARGERNITTLNSWFPKNTIDARMRRMAIKVKTFEDGKTGIRNFHQQAYLLEEATWFIDNDQITDGIEYHIVSKDIIPMDVIDGLARIYRGKKLIIYRYPSAESDPEQVYPQSNFNSTGVSGSAQIMNPPLSLLSPFGGSMRAFGLSLFLASTFGQMIWGSNPAEAATPGTTTVTTPLTAQAPAVVLEPATPPNPTPPQAPFALGIGAVMAGGGGNGKNGRDRDPNNETKPSEAAPIRDPESSPAPATVTKAPADHRPLPEFKGKRSDLFKKIEKPEIKEALQNYKEYRDLAPDEYSRPWADFVEALSEDQVSALSLLALFNFEGQSILTYILKDPNRFQFFMNLRGVEIKGLIAATYERSSFVGRLFETNPRWLADNSIGRRILRAYHYLRLADVTDRIKATNLITQRYHDENRRLVQTKGKTWESFTEETIYLWMGNVRSYIEAGDVAMEAYLDLSPDAPKVDIIDPILDNITPDLKSIGKDGTKRYDIIYEFKYPPRVDNIETLETSDKVEIKRFRNQTKENVKYFNDEKHRSDKMVYVLFREPTPAVLEYLVKKFQGSDLTIYFKSWDGPRELLYSSKKVLPAPVIAAEHKRTYDRLALGEMNREQALAELAKASSQEALVEPIQEEAPLSPAYPEIAVASVFTPEIQSRLGGNGLLDFFTNNSGHYFHIDAQGNLYSFDFNGLKTGNDKSHQKAHELLTAFEAQYAGLEMSSSKEAKKLLLMARYVIRILYQTSDNHKRAILAGGFHSHILSGNVSRESIISGVQWLEKTLSRELKERDVLVINDIVNLKAPEAPENSLQAQEVYSAKYYIYIPKHLIGQTLADYQALAERYSKMPPGTKVHHVFRKGTLLYTKPQPFDADTVFLVTSKETFASDESEEVILDGTKAFRLKEDVPLTFFAGEFPYIFRPVKKEELYYRPRIQVDDALWAPQYQAPALPTPFTKSVPHIEDPQQSSDPKAVSKLEEKLEELRQYAHPPSNSVPSVQKNTPNIKIDPDSPLYQKMGEGKILTKLGSPNAQALLSVLAAADSVEEANQKLEFLNGLNHEEAEGLKILLETEAALSADSLAQKLLALPQEVPAGYSSSRRALFLTSVARSRSKTTAASILNDYTPQRRGFDLAGWQHICDEFIDTYHYKKASRFAARHQAAGEFIIKIDTPEQEGVKLAAYRPNPSPDPAVMGPAQEFCDQLLADVRALPGYNNEVMARKIENEIRQLRNLLYNSELKVFKGLIEKNKKRFKDIKRRNSIEVAYRKIIEAKTEQLIHRAAGAPIDVLDLNLHASAKSPIVKIGQATAKNPYRTCYLLLDAKGYRDFLENLRKGNIVIPEETFLFEKKMGTADLSAMIASFPSSEWMEKGIPVKDPQFIVELQIPKASNNQGETHNIVIKYDATGAHGDGTHRTAHGSMLKQAAVIPYSEFKANFERENPGQTLEPYHLAKTYDEKNAEPSTQYMPLDGITF